MKICFYSNSGPSAETLRQCVRSSLGAIVDLTEMPLEAWRDAVAEAELAVIDVTAASPQAMYLLGLADAAGKRSALLAAIENSLPKDFGHRPVIVHGWNLEFLKSELAKLSTDDSEVAPGDDTPAGQFQKQFGDLLKMHGYFHRGPVEFDGTTFTLRDQEMELPLVQEISKRAKALNLRVRLL
jgi:hypothetical protein